MRKLVAGSLAAAALSFALTAAPALSADASVEQIYAAVRAGHLSDAQQMMDQVLRDHPDSAKAHYVQAELYAKEGNPGLARSELARAEQLKPGLPDVNPQSVRELKQELGLASRGDLTTRVGGERTLGMAPAAHRFPWGAVLLLILVIGVLAMVFRRRTYVRQYPAGPGPMTGPGGYGPGYGPGGGYGGYGGPAPGGGMGSSIAGGLAGGLAAGAGIVAGEELAHHFLDGNEHTAAAAPVSDEEFRNANGDMGGNDFGVNDPGSWDDGSGGGDFGGGDSGGGGDWS